MALTATYRYTLQPYAGPASRYACPVCRKPRCFTRYVDTDTGELLPDTYGRCDREIKCGYYRNPYHDGGVGEGKGRLISTAPASGRRRRPRSMPPPVLTIPADVVSASLHPRHYRDNALAQLLREHFGQGVADDLFRRFRLGTAAFWPGACVFWVVDVQGRARGGQVVLYDATGHTIKTPFRHTRWAHTALAQAYRQRGQPQPQWLEDYNVHGLKSPCLFGLHQLPAAPAGQPVALVESAKTAIMATHYLPEFVWMATMGLGNLTEERLRPLKDRPLFLFPDAGAFEQWNQKAQELRRLGYKVKVSDVIEKIATPEERRDGMDLADVFLREWPGFSPN